MSPSITLEQLSQHNSKDNLWIAVEGKVYDITQFQKRHPGGSSILNKVGGTDATKHFLKFHPTSVLRILEASEFVGVLSTETSASADKADKREHTLSSSASETSSASAEEVIDPIKSLDLNNKHKPDLGEIYNLFDFEVVAKHTMNRTGWYYYSSGADDEITLRENHRAYQRVWFRPKILVNVSEVDYSTTILGQPSKSPFYLSATALGKLGHDDGETVLTKAAYKAGVIQMLSTLSSASTDEVMEVAKPGQAIWQQIYVNSDREVTKRFIQHGEKLGVQGFFVTVDAPQLGRREKDMRSKYDAELADVQGDGEDVDRDQGVSRAISSFIDPALSWDDIPFLLSCTTKPLVIKGVGRWEDAVKAAEYGLAGVVLSNHGGRQLEFSRSPLEVLAETMPELRKRNLHNKLDVFVDGGIRRGTDVLKALCLGAKAVGIARPFLYAMSTYGEPGVSKAIKLLNEEIEMNMRLLGVTKLSELEPSMLDVRNLSSHDAVPVDHTSDQVYERLQQPQFKHRL